ncbi:MAG TPA: META domain-containing protein [Thermoanaerobaculia bacterium]|nr:META domain-containing protein [Thermoanaerobaculia bacterium]
MRTASLLPALVVLACASAGVHNTTWTLASIGGNAPVAGANVTLQFGNDAASGNGGCNQYRATFTTNGSALTFGPAMSTKRACVESSMNAQETAYFDALSRVASYERSDDRLVLRDASGVPLLEFNAK